MNENTSPTFSLDSWGVGSSRLLSPASPVLTETLGLWNEGAQRVFLESVWVFKGEPLPVLPLGEHKFHYIQFLTTPESKGLHLLPKGFFQSKNQEEARQSSQDRIVSRLGEGRPLATKTQLRGLPLGLQTQLHNTSDKTKILTWRWSP